VRAVNDQQAGGVQAAHVGVVFLESIVTDPEVIQQGMDFKITHSADFAGLEPAEAYKDLAERIGHYEKSYETVRQEEGAYIKLFNLRATAHCSNIFGRMSKSVLPYLLALHSVPRPIYMLVVDEADEGAWASLPVGATRWVQACDHAAEIRILSSTMPQALEAASEFAALAQTAPPAERAQLSPLGRGTASRPASNRSDSFSSKHGEKYAERFGERVVNLVARLEPIVLEMEASTQPILLVAHEASVRTLRSFLLKPQSPAIAERERVDTSFAPSPTTLLEFFPSAGGGFAERMHDLAAACPRQLV